MADFGLEEKIVEIDRKTLFVVENTLKKINVALNLNAPKLKEKKISPDLKRLLEWKKALEYWEERYGKETNDVVFMAERLGAFYDLCATIE